jgi:hypothetical protein
VITGPQSYFYQFEGLSLEMAAPEALFQILIECFPEKSFFSAIYWCIWMMS